MYGRVPFRWNVQNRQVHRNRKQTPVCQGREGEAPGAITDGVGFCVGWQNVLTLGHVPSYRLGNILGTNDGDAVNGSMLWEVGCIL